MRSIIDVSNSQAWPICVCFSDGSIGPVRVPAVQYVADSSSSRNRAAASPPESSRAMPATSRSSSVSGAAPSRTAAPLPRTGNESATGPALQPVRARSRERDTHNRAAAAANAVGSASASPRAAPRSEGTPRAVSSWSRRNSRSRWHRSPTRLWTGVAVTSSTRAPTTSRASARYRLVSGLRKRWASSTRNRRQRAAAGGNGRRGVALRDSWVIIGALVSNRASSARHWSTSTAGTTSANGCRTAKATARATYDLPRPGASASSAPP